MKVKKLISAILACVMVMTISAPQVVAAEKPQNINQAGQTEAFFDDFSGNALDTGKWPGSGKNVGRLEWRCCS